MVQFKPFGKGDIFGILLPGFILVLAFGYILFTVNSLFFEIGAELMNNQFLLIFILLVTAYIFGSFLRLFAADNIDIKSGLRILKSWDKNFRKLFKEPWPSGDNSIIKMILGFNKKVLKLHRKADNGMGKMDIPDFLNTIVDTWESKYGEKKDRENFHKIRYLFEEWLWGVDVFPYHAWLKQFWSSHGFTKISDFYSDAEYKECMWGKGKSSPKSFFNYCKLAIDGEEDSQFIEDVNTTESHTRYLAGSTTACTFTCWILGIFFILTPLIYFMNQVFTFLPPKAGFTSLITYSIITILLGIICIIIRNQMIKAFRKIRIKEVETVYYAFYLQNHRKKSK